MLAKRFVLAAGLGASALAGTALQAATYTTDQVIRDVHSAHSAPHVRDLDYLIVNNTYPRWGADNYENIAFIKFDLSSLPTTFNAAGGDTASLSLTAYVNGDITGPNSNRPLLAGVTGLQSIDVEAINDSTLDLAKADLTPQPYPALTPVVSEQLITGSGVYTFDITSLFQQWIDDPSTNLGLAIHGRNDFDGVTASGIPNTYFVASSGPDSGHVFDGYVSADAFGPRLTVTLAEAVAVPSPASAGLAVMGLVVVAMRRRRGVPPLK